MDCVLYVCSDLVSLLSFCLILRYIFKEIPRQGKWRPLLCAGLSVCASAVGYLLLPARTEHAFELLDFFATLLGLAAIPFLFKKPRFWRGFAVLFIYYATIDTLWSFISSFFDPGIVFEAAFSLIVTSIVSIAVYKSAKQKNLNVMAGAFHEIPVWLLISLFLFELTSYYKEFGLSKTWYNVLYAVSACLIFLSILYLVFRVFRLVYTQNDILRQLNDQLIHADEQKKSDEALRRFRHDVKNHTIVMNAMLEQGDYEGAKKYFSSLTEEATAAVRRFSTGSSVIDSLLEIKTAAAQEQGTELIFDGIVPDKGIEPKDMCICFGNLLDNALEACAALPRGAERFVKIQSIVRNNMWILSFTNPAQTEKRFREGQLPKTTKKDVRAHGIGLKNVRDTVNKYNGSLHLSIENGEFIAETLFELTSAEAEQSFSNQPD